MDCTLFLAIYLNHHLLFSCCICAAMVSVQLLYLYSCGICTTVVVLSHTDGIVICPQILRDDEQRLDYDYMLDNPGLMWDCDRPIFYLLLELYMSTYI